MADKREHERMRSFLTALREELGSIGSFTTPAQKAGVERQIERMDKRAIQSDANDQLHDTALHNFLVINQVAKHVVVKLNRDIVDTARDYIIRALWSTNQRFTTSPQCLVHFPLFADLWAFGPGASNGIKGTHFYDKIHSQVTCTEQALPLVRLLRRLNPHTALYDRVSGMDYTLISGSRMTTVPKNNQINRTICIEPSGNMMFQLAIGKYLELVLRDLGNDISTQQDANKYGAWAGSVTQEFSTIDLSNASDLITPTLIKTLWPSEWYTLFMQVRSPETSVKFSNGDEHTVRLRMISTMGNGFTFPLMTLTLKALMFACTGLQCDVFGDDIIVPTKYFDIACATLQASGLVVNTSKSYSEGPFRESCGGDYYEGVDITPFYPRLLSSNTDIYVVINQLLAWCAKTNIWCPDSYKLLKSYIKGQPFLVPEWEQDFAGIRCRSVTSKYKAYSVVIDRQRCNKYRGNPFLLFCILGGYVSNDKRLGTYYTPRPHIVKYKVVERSMPHGRLDGRCQSTYNVADIVQKQSEDLRAVPVRTERQSQAIDIFLSVA